MVPFGRTSTVVADDDVILSDEEVEILKEAVFSTERGKKRRAKQSVARKRAKAKGKKRIPKRPSFYKITMKIEVPRRWFRSVPPEIIKEDKKLALALKAKRHKQLNKLEDGEGGYNCNLCGFLYHKTPSDKECHNCPFVSVPLVSFVSIQQFISDFPTEYKNLLNVYAKTNVEVLNQKIKEARMIQKQAKEEREEEAKKAEEAEEARKEAAAKK